jgi:hypothetical protein
MLNVIVYVFLGHQKVHLCHAKMKNYSMANFWKNIGLKGLEQFYFLLMKIRFPFSFWKIILNILAENLGKFRENKT